MTTKRENVVTALQQTIEHLQKNLETFATQMETDELDHITVNIFPTAGKMVYWSCDISNNVGDVMMTTQEVKGGI